MIIAKPEQEVSQTTSNRNSHPLHGFGGNYAPIDFTDIKAKLAQRKLDNSKKKENKTKEKNNKSTNELIFDLQNTFQDMLEKQQEKEEKEEQEEKLNKSTTNDSNVLTPEFNSTSSSPSDSFVFSSSDSTSSILSLFPNDSNVLTPKESFFLSKEKEKATEKEKEKKDDLKESTLPIQVNVKTQPFPELETLYHGKKNLNLSFRVNMSRLERTKSVDLSTLQVSISKSNFNVQDSVDLILSFPYSNWFFLGTVLTSDIATLLVEKTKSLMEENQISVKMVEWLSCYLNSLNECLSSHDASQSRRLCLTVDTEKSKQICTALIVLNTDMWWIKNKKEKKDQEEKKEKKENAKSNKNTTIASLENNHEDSCCNVESVVFAFSLLFLSFFVGFILYGFNSKGSNIYYH
jgi:hypothetical protein